MNAGVANKQLAIFNQHMEDMCVQQNVHTHVKVVSVLIAPWGNVLVSTYRSIHEPRLFEVIL